MSPKSDKIVLDIFKQADLIISAGYDPIEMRIGWRHLWDPAKVIEFAHAPNDHDMHYSGLSWVCGVAGGLAALAAEGGPAEVWACEVPTQIRADLLEAFSPTGNWGPDHAMAEILAALPDNVATTVDSGAHRILLSQHFYCKTPRALTQSTALCTMGCALPLGLGHKIADPSRPVVTFQGDACMEMVLGEMATVRDSGLPIVIVVFVDQSLSLIELKQRREGLQNLGVDFDRTDFAALARLYGGYGVTVEEPGDAGPAMQKALTADRFTLIEIMIPRRAYDGLI